MITAAASLLAMGYYILTAIFTLAFMRRRARLAVLYNVMFMQGIQALAALVAATAYAVADDLIFAVWWGIIACLAISAVRMSYRQINNFRVLTATERRLNEHLRKLIDHILEQPK